jgi:hypothetical protein
MVIVVVDVTGFVDEEDTWSANEAVRMRQAVTP